MTDLTALWHINRRWRAWMDANTPFKTPDTLDTLRYALIESCECLDSWLRVKNPDHARNNGRDHTVESELADTAMLLLTALPESIFLSVPAAYDHHTSASLDAICLHLAECVHWHLTDENWTWQAYQVLLWIANHPGLDLPAELDLCWRRLATKHGWNVWAEWAGVKTYQDRITFHARLIRNPAVVPAPWLVEES